MEPRNRFQGNNSASLCRPGGRYDNPIPSRFLAPIDCLKIPAQFSSRNVFWLGYTCKMTEKEENFCREPVIHEANIRGGRKTVHFVFKYLKYLSSTACGGGGRSNAYPLTLLYFADPWIFYFKTT
jgi:hypothetical protein